MSTISWNIAILITQLITQMENPHFLLECFNIMILIWFDLFHIHNTKIKAFFNVTFIIILILNLFLSTDKNKTSFFYHHFSLLILCSTLLPIFPFMDYLPTLCQPFLACISVKLKINYFYQFLIIYIHVQSLLFHFSVRWKSLLKTR